MYREEKKVVLKTEFLANYTIDRLIQGKEIIKQILNLKCVSVECIFFPLSLIICFTESCFLGGLAIPTGLVCILHRYYSQFWHRLSSFRVTN